MSSPRSPRKRGGHEEEHANHERWLISYADMVTLLMVLFIVMFAISQVDEKRFVALKEGMASGFGQSVSILNGSDAVLEQPGMAPMPPVSAANFESDPASMADREVIEEAVAEVERLRNQRRYAEADAEVNRLEGVRLRLLDALKEHNLVSDVRMRIDGRGLTVSLVSHHVVFAANLASLTPRGKEVVDVLSPVLRELPDDLQIDGHTNQVPVQPRYFPTDWELSSARAVTVLRRLNEVGGVANERLAAVAFGHERPLMDPDKAGSQRLNKRVDIVVLSGLPEETRRLLDQAAASSGTRTEGSR